MDVLKSMLEQDPANHFVRYGVAMEHKNTGDLEGAVGQFRTLLSSNPDYVAAYFHAGLTLEEMGRLEEAKDVYQQGIEASGRVGDLHTQAEIKGALDLL